MQKYLGYKIGDEVINKIGERYEITAIAKQSDGVYFSLKGKVRSVCNHELVMVNYPLAQQHSRRTPRALDLLSGAAKSAGLAQPANQ